MTTHCDRMEESDSSASTGDMLNCDDQPIEIALAKHCAAIKQKKNKEKEDSFLLICQKELNNDLTIPTTKLQMCIQAIENKYSEFVVEYAATEDRIRQLWSSIQQEHNQLAALLKVRREQNMLRIKSLEEKQVLGLKDATSACREYDFVADKLFQAA